MFPTSLRFLSLAPAGAILAGSLFAVPVTGPGSPGMEAYDRLLTGLMHKYGVPGGAVAVSRSGRLILARGYGYAERETGQVVEPDALFRIASLSKPVTGAAVLKLVEQGRLKLDSRVVDLLPQFELPSGADPGWEVITVRHLLWHAGGWDSGKQGGYDPMFQSLRIAGATGTPCPPKAETIMRWMMGQPLDFRPGNAFAYSNFGYSVLGRLIESISGERYEDYVRKNLLAPAGIGRMRLGASEQAGRARGEVRYYDYPGAARVSSVLGAAASAPRPYGGFCLETMDSHGGWIASAIDLLRFANALDGRRPPALLGSGAVRQMLARPPAPVAAPDAAAFYGMSWLVRPLPGGEAHWWHTGSLPGTAALLVRAGNDGMCWAALFNMRPEAANTFISELDATMWQAFSQTVSFPDHDLFPQFPSPQSGESTRKARKPARTAGSPVASRQAPGRAVRRTHPM